jgi:hypothetical protein
MLSIICHGRYEVLKASVHGVALSVAALCAVYNFAAWVGRRQRHSWINAVLYGALTAWEVHHVQHHLNCRVRVVTIDPPADAERAA